MKKNKSNNNYKNNVLCIAAHPDDEALGVGGTLIKHASQGDSVNIIILSEGEDAKSKNNKKNPYRKKNALNWANYANSKYASPLNDFFLLDKDLMLLVQLLDIVKNFEKPLKILNGHIIYSSSWDESDNQIPALLSRKSEKFNAIIINLNNLCNYGPDCGYGTCDDLYILHTPTN